jgi:hypothetical protein
MKRVGFEIEKQEEEAFERDWMRERMEDNGRESVDGVEAEDSADKGMTKRRAGVRSG